MTLSFRFRNSNFCLEKDSVTPYEWNSSRVKFCFKIKGERNERLSFFYKNFVLYTEFNFCHLQLKMAQGEKDSNWK